MKKRILLLAILASINTMAQAKNRKSINAGFCKTDLYSKLFLIDKGCIEGCYVTEQHPRAFFDLSFMYEIYIGKH